MNHDAPIIDQLGNPRIAFADSHTVLLKPHPLQSYRSPNSLCQHIEALSVHQPHNQHYFGMKAATSLSQSSFSIYQIRQNAPRYPKSDAADDRVRDSCDIPNGPYTPLDETTINFTNRSALHFLMFPAFHSLIRIAPVLWRESETVGGRAQQHFCYPHPILSTVATKQRFQVRSPLERWWPPGHVLRNNLQQTHWDVAAQERQPLQQKPART